MAHLLEFSTFSRLPSVCFSYIVAFKHVGHQAGLNFIHKVQNQMKCILLNEQPRDISLVRLHDQICCVYQTMNDVSVCHYFSETKKFK